MKRVKVREVLELQRRQVNVDPAAEYGEIGVRSFGKGIFHKDPIKGIDLGSKRVFAVHPGDLVFSNVFAWEGAVALAGSAEAGRIGSHRFMTYIPTDDGVDVSYLRYYFTSEAGVALLGGASPGSAGRNRTLAVDRFEAIEIPLPDIKDQRRIAAHLDLVSGTIHRIRCHRSIARARTDALPSAVATPLQSAEDARIEAGWKLLPLGAVMERSADSVEVVMENSYPNIGVFSFGQGVFEKPPIDGMETSAKTLNRVRAAQFIYSRLFAFKGAYAYVPDDFDGFFVSNEFPSFDVDPSIATAEFIAAALRSPQQWRELAAWSKGLGLNRQRINVEALLAHELWFPPISEQHRIAEALQQLDRVRDLLETSDSIAASVFPAALNRAFAGLA